MVESKGDGSIGCAHVILCEASCGELELNRPREGPDDSCEGRSTVHSIAVPSGSLAA